MYSFYVIYLAESQSLLGLSTKTEILASDGNRKLVEKPTAIRRP
jgi:hypothetical protein